jgi:hypothetical protein
MIQQISKIKENIEIVSQMKILQNVWRQVNLGISKQNVLNQNLRK